MKLGMVRPGGSLSGVKWRRGSPGRGAVQVLLHSSTRHSDSGSRTVCGCVSVAWNAVSTPGWSHSVVRVLTQRIENQ
jgi:hypothetical protein